MTKFERVDRHAVGFYDGDDELVAAVAAYAAEGLARGERVLALLTSEHRTAVDEALAAAGVDPVRARRDSSYVTLEAGHTLASLLVDGRPDRAAFADGVGRMVGAACQDGSDLRVFGEMVSLLWDRGAVVAALELEGLWNDLGQQHDFSLLCSYSTTALDGTVLGEIDRICTAHTTVVPPTSYASAARDQDVDGDRGAEEWSEVFLPVPEAVAGARRFVTSSLMAWGAPDLVWEATLLTSELATNAVVHGRSPFRLRVLRLPGSVRIAIEDAASTWPRQRVATSLDLDGRGMAIIEALADRRGYDALPGGKIAWAELSAGPHP